MQQSCSLAWQFGWREEEWDKVVGTHNLETLSLYFLSQSHHISVCLFHIFLCVCLTLYKHNVVFSNSMNSHFFYLLSFIILCAEHYVSYITSHNFFLFFRNFFSLNLSVSIFSSFYVVVVNTLIYYFVFHLFFLFGSV